MLLVLAAVILGGRVADSALSVPGPPVQVAAGLSVRLLSGWRPVGQGPGVLLTRGSGNLSVVPAAGGADPADLADAYVRQGRATPVEGEVTAVVGRQAAAVFDTWAPLRCTSTSGSTSRPSSRPQRWPDMGSRPDQRIVRHLNQWSSS